MKYPYIITRHSLKRRTERAVADATADADSVDQVRSVVDALYKFYSRSPKTKRKLETEATELKHKKIGRVLDTRWMASSFTAVNAVNSNNFDYLAAHLNASSDPSSQYLTRN